MSDTIKSYVEELRHTINIAWLNYEIWWVYKSKETRTEFRDTIHAYPLFFNTSLHAHFVASAVALSRLYETRSDTYNIPEFIKLLDSNEAVPPEAIEKLKALFEKAKPLWIKVNILRNDTIGHRSRKRTVEEAFKKAEMSANNMRDLMEITKELLNAATLAWDRSTYAFGSSVNADTMRLLENLRKAT